MSHSIRPRVVVSKCLGFDACRYNGEMLQDRFLRALEPHVEFVFVCPEVEIGLGVPRDPVRLVSAKGEPGIRLVQMPKNVDLTDRMRQFSRDFLNGLPPVDGFVLKGASPSCAIKDSKIYGGIEKSPSLGRGPGMFGEAVLKRFPEITVEDEGRLKNLTLREHFLTRIFASARFRAVAGSGAMRHLVEFQKVNKFLLMAYNQKEMRQLGQIVANSTKQGFDSVVAEYSRHLRQALSRAPRYTSNINVLMHAFGYVSDRLTSREKAFFLDQLQLYREGKIPLTAVVSVLSAWMVRFEVEYVVSQTFFEPFPLELVTMRDSGKGRQVG